MTLKDIRDRAWMIARETSNSDSSRLWSKAEMNYYINWVYRRIARETRCIRDAVTPAICQITATPAQDFTIALSNPFALYTSFAVISLAPW